MTTNTAPAAAPAWATIWTAAALAELPADLTTATPAQVDEVIRTVELDLQTLDRNLGHAIDTLRLAVGQKRERSYQGTGRNRETITTWVGGSVADAVLYARDHRAEDVKGYIPAYDINTIGDALDAADSARAAIDTARDLVETMAAEFDRRGGWTRYFRVNNTNGHVHTSLDCRTTYPTTQWQWPTQLSGADAHGVVDAAGALTCLACFPQVRAEILAGRPTDDRAFETREQTASREEREAEKDAKLKAKIAKGVTPDGSPLMVHEPGYGAGDQYAIKTARAAELRYVEWASDARFYASVGRTEQAEENRGSAEQVLPALAWKRGETVEQTREHFAAKVTAKFQIRAKRGW